MIKQLNPAQTGSRQTQQDKKMVQLFQGQEMAAVAGDMMLPLD